ncbi:hypothetical protein D3C86_627230 [compost metagenome]
MTSINGQARIHDMFVRSGRPAPEPQEGDETEEAIKASVANKTDVAVGNLIGSTSISSKVVNGDATAAAIEATKVVAKTMSTSPEVADGIAKGATVVSSAVAAAKGDHFAAAATAKNVLKNSPNLAPLAVVADAVMIATGDKKLSATVEEVKKEAKKVVSPLTTKGDRLKSGLQLAQHTQSGVILSQQIVDAAGDLVRWLGKSPAFKGMTSGLGRIGAAISASPLGTLVRKLGKFMPVLNFAALANSVRIGLDIWRDPRSSKTSKGLVAGSVASGMVLFGASIVTGGAALIPAAAAFGIATELGLIATRKRDLEQGNTDRQMASYLANPAEGAKALGKLVVDTGNDIVKTLTSTFKSLGDKITGRKAKPAPAADAKTAPSGMLGAVPKLDS